MAMAYDKKQLKLKKGAQKIKFSHQNFYKEHIERVIMLFEHLFDGLH